jgi:hypothetical protein
MQADMQRADTSARVRLRRQRACAPALSYAADCWHEDDWVDKAGVRFTCFTGTKVRILMWVDKADWSDQTYADIC